MNKGPPNCGGFFIFDTMKYLLYDFSIRLYGGLILLTSIFNRKAKNFIQGRKGIFQRLQGDFQDNQSPVAWFHCASLGEFEQGKPVIEKFRTAYPTHKILVTFFSPSGYEVRKTYEGADFIYYLPLDYRKNAKQFIRIVNPAIVFFVKYEFWYHYLHQIHQNQTPVFCISALFTKKHIFFKWYGSLHRKMLGFFNHLFVQDKNSQKLLAGINMTNVSIAGDTRFDRVYETSKSPAQFPLIEKFKGQDSVMVIGSSWPEDMEVLLPIIHQKIPSLKFIIAPHLTNEASISTLEKGIRVNHVRYTKANKEDIKKAQVLIIDTIGMLSSLYQYGKLAYIGGAFGDGLHNILEAVTFGLPVFFGNKGLEKFPESLELIRRGGAVAVADKQEMQGAFGRLWNDETAYEEASGICRQFVRENLGATDKIIQHIQNFLII